MELLGAAEDAVGFAELGERRGRRLDLERSTGHERRRGILPRAFEHALHEVVHDERRFAEEAALPLRLLDMEDDLVPLALLQRAHRDLMPEDFLPGVFITGRERAAGADLDAVDEELVRALEVAEVHADRFLEEITLVLGEERVVDLDPGPEPEVGRDGRAGGGRRDRREGLRGGARDGQRGEAPGQAQTEGHGVEDETSEAGVGRNLRRTSGADNRDIFRYDGSPA